jgi:hypothetical protein
VKASAEEPGSSRASTAGSVTGGEPPAIGPRSTSTMGERQAAPAERQAPALEDGGVERGGELGQQPRLAHAGVAADDDERRATGVRRRQRGGEPAQLGAAADEPRGRDPRGHGQSLRSTCWPAEAPIPGPCPGGSEDPGRDREPRAAGVS